MKSNSSPSRATRMKPHFSATSRLHLIIDRAKLRVQLRPCLLDSPTKEACSCRILSEGAMTRGVVGSPAGENELAVESNRRLRERVQE